MNNQAFFQEVGLSIVFSVVLATPAYSKILPISHQEYNFNSTHINGIKNLETQIKSIDLGIIYQAQNHNISPKKYDYYFPFLTEEISAFSSRGQKTKIDKKNNKDFTTLTANIYLGEDYNSSKNYQESQNRALNSTNISELISYLPHEDIQPLPSHEEKSLLLPPISEKQTLIDRYNLLKKKAEKIAEENRVAAIDIDRFGISENTDTLTTLRLIDLNSFDYKILNSKVEWSLENSSFINVDLTPSKINHTKFSISENLVKQKLEENSHSIIPNKQHQITNKNFLDIQQNNLDLVEINQPESNLISLSSKIQTASLNLTEKFLAEDNSKKTQKQQPESNNIFRVNEIEQPLTTAAALYQPDIIITNISENISQDIRIAQQIIQVTNIRLNSTPEGLQIILETLSGEKLQVRTAIDGNTLIVNIPNAVLSLPDTEEFSAKNPITGVSNVTATTLNFNTIQIRIDGETNLPIASLLPTDEGLSLNVEPVIDDEEIEVVIEEEKIEDEKIEVTRRAGATEEDIPRSITVIPREEIENQNSVSATNSVSDILGRLVPGYGPPASITRRNRGQTLRGRPALILIDGVVQNANNGIGEELNTIDPSAIERIEVIRGSSALYGSGSTGGIVNIVTRNPSKGLEQEVRVGYSNFAGEEFFPNNGSSYNSRYRISGTVGNFSWGLNTSLNQNNRLYDAEGDIIPTTDTSGARSLNFLTTLGLDLNQEQRLKFKYNLYNDRTFFRYDTDLENRRIYGLQKPNAIRIPTIDYEEAPEQTNHNISLTYDHDNLFGSQIYTQLFFQRTYFRSVTQGPTENFEGDVDSLFQQGAQTSKLGTRIQITTPFSESASILWGLDYTNERNRGQSNSIDVEAFIERQEANIIERTRNVPNFELKSLGLFAEGQWDIAEKILLSGGVRHESIDADIEDWVSNQGLAPILAGEPVEFEGGTNRASGTVLNAGILYKASSKVSLFFNFAQGFSLPSLGFLSAASDPEDVNLEGSGLLDPQTVSNYEVGIRRNSESIEFTVSTFYNFSERGVNLSLGQDDSTEINRSPQRNYGVEATVDWKPTNTWSLGGTFTWTEGDGYNPSGDQGYLPLSTLSVQPMKVTLYLQNQTLPNWRNRMQMLFVGDRFRAFDEGVDLFQGNGYITFDLVSIYELGLGRLQLGVENVFNRQYTPIATQNRIGFNEFRYFPATGRNISIRYFLKF